MTDDNLVKQWDEYVESMGSVMGNVEHMTQQMRDRIEQLTSERDKAYARGYSDAETEISESALGQKNTFLHSQYANAAARIKDLNGMLDEALAEGSKYASSWMTDREMALRDAASAAKSSCVKCGGDGWQWGYELDDPPGDEAPRPDDTRYSCDGGGCKASTVILNLIKK